MVNGYTYAKHSQGLNYYCSKKNNRCRARVKLDENGFIKEKTEDFVHNHPPPKYKKLTNGMYIKI